MIWNEILSQIMGDVAEIKKDSQVDAGDEDLLKTSEKESSKYGKQYDRRDRLYSDLLHNYIRSNKSKSNWNKWYKLAFFIVSLASFVGILVVSLYVLIMIAINGGNSVSDVAVVIGGTSGVISSIIVLPKIIAVHLFPTNEDANMINMVQNMQKNDSGIRNTENKEKETTNKNKNSNK